MCLMQRVRHHCKNRECDTRFYTTVSISKPCNSETPFRCEEEWDEYDMIAHTHYCYYCSAPDVQDTIKDQAIQNYVYGRISDIGRVDGFYIELQRSAQAFAACREECIGIASEIIKERNAKQEERQRGKQEQKKENVSDEEVERRRREHLKHGRPQRYEEAQERVAQMRQEQRRESQPHNGGRRPSRVPQDPVFLGEPDDAYDYATRRPSSAGNDQKREAYSGKKMHPDTKPTYYDARGHGQEGRGDDRLPPGAYRPVQPPPSSRNSHRRDDKPRQKSRAQ